jgi:hypothetical protein
MQVHGIGREELREYRGVEAGYNLKFSENSGQAATSQHR